MSSKKSSSPSRPAAKAAPKGAPQQPSRPAAAAPVRKWSLSAFLSKPAVVYAVTFVALWFFCQMVYGDVFARAALLVTLICCAWLLKSGLDRRRQNLLTLKEACRNAQNGDAHPTTRQPTPSQTKRP